SHRSHPSHLSHLSHRSHLCICAPDAISWRPVTATGHNGGGVMIWFFERGTDSLKIETRFNNEAGLFELVWHHPDGTRTMEAFTQEAEFRQRSEEVEAHLLEDAWEPASSPQLLRDGWKVG
ncbi:MAG TPA: hypothetical protein VI589_12550, partial [Vicinamibacteria bacterium]